MAFNCYPCPCAERIIAFQMVNLLRYSLWKRTRDRGRERTWNNSLSVPQQKKNKKRKHKQKNEDLTSRPSAPLSIQNKKKRLRLAVCTHAFTWIDAKYQICSHKHSSKIRPVRLKGVSSHFPSPFERYNAATIPSAPHPDKGRQYSHSLRHWLRKSPYIRILRG